jgi:hypothetical protein
MIVKIQRALGGEPNILIYDRNETFIYEEPISDEMLNLFEVDNNYNGNAFVSRVDGRLLKAKVYARARIKKCANGDNTLNIIEIVNDRDW